MASDLVLWCLAPEIQTGDHVLPGFVFVGVENLEMS